MGKPISSKTGFSAAAAASSCKLIKPSKPTPPVSERKSPSRNTMDPQTTGDSLRVPLSAVVADCANRWFKETLQEAKGGDIGLQVLVAHMYYSGYGVPRDARKGRIWMSRASKIRSSVWSVRDKHPGYNASDSDSD